EKDNEDNLGKLRRLKAHRPQAEPPVGVVGWAAKQHEHEQNQLKPQSRKKQARIRQTPVVPAHRCHHQHEPHDDQGELVQQEVVAAAVELRGHHCRSAEDHQRAEQYQHHHGPEQNLVGLKSSRHFDSALCCHAQPPGASGGNCRSLFFSPRRRLPPTDPASAELPDVLEAVRPSGSSPRLAVAMNSNGRASSFTTSSGLNSTESRSDNVSSAVGPSASVLRAGNSSAATS